MNLVGIHQPSLPETPIVKEQILWGSVGYLIIGFVIVLDGLRESSMKHYLFRLNDVGKSQ